MGYNRRQSENHLQSLGEIAFGEAKDYGNADFRFRETVSQM